MNYQTHSLINKYEDNLGVWVYRFKPIEQNTIFPFLSGQYVFLKNPNFKPGEQHPFSIASSPTETLYLEFCIKVYGDWTDELTQLETGNTIEISEPQGTFVWDSKVTYAVFLLGGIGISPIMSMLRYLQAKHETLYITILYGNRTPNSITYQQELNKLSKINPHMHIVDIFSDVPESEPLPNPHNYRGFITKDIIQKEADFQKNPTFFIVGPPVFIDLMQKILADFSHKNDQIRIEKLEEKK